MMLPILISVSVAPAAYFFWASALPDVAAKAMIAVANAAIRNSCLESIVSPHSSVFLELADQVLGNHGHLSRAAPDSPFEIPSAMFGTKIMKAEPTIDPGNQPTPPTTMPRNSEIAKVMV